MTFYDVISVAALPAHFPILYDGAFMKCMKFILNKHTSYMRIPQAKCVYTCARHTNEIGILIRIMLGVRH